jgi:hypothetical protein
MACSTCKSTNTTCGCKDVPLTTAPSYTCPPDIKCPDPTPCYETIQDTCVKHSLDYSIANFGRLLANGDPYPTLAAGASLENAYQAMSVEILDEACLPPVNVHPSYVGTTTIVLNWENTGAGYYIAAIGTTETGPFTPTVNLSATTYTFVNLNPSTRYYFKVQSYCNGGSDFSFGATIAITTKSAL